MGDELPIFSPNFGKPEEKPKQEAAPVHKDGLPDLRAWRVARGWSQFEAAKQTGLSLSTWIRWETKGVPELKKAKLKEILKCSRSTEI